MERTGIKGTEKQLDLKKSTVERNWHKRIDSVGQEKEVRENTGEGPHEKVRGNKRKRVERSREGEERSGEREKRGLDKEK